MSPAAAARRLPAAAGLILATLPTAGALAQDVAPGVGSKAAAQLLSVVGFVSTPDITASRINVDGDGTLDGQRIDSIRLANDLVVPFDWGDLYLEGNLGFARADVDLILPSGIVPNVKVDAVGTFAGVGPSFNLGDATTLRPIGIFGIGYINNDLNLLDRQGGAAEADFDLRQWTGALGFGVNIDHERTIGQNTIDLRLKVSQVFLKTLWAAEDRFAGDTSNQTINANAVYKHDTGVKLGNYPLLVTGLLGANAFLGDQQDALGFAWFAEYGGGLELNLEPAEAWVQRARIRVTGIAGDGVTGISLGVGVGF